MDFLIDGQISSFCPDKHEAKLLTLIHRTFFSHKRLEFFWKQNTIAIALIHGLRTPYEGINQLET